MTFFTVFGLRAAFAVTGAVSCAVTVVPPAVPDATAPDLPTGATPPDFVNIANENAVPVRVDLPPTSTPTDVVSVTLTDTAVTLGPLRLELGKEPQMGPCPICRKPTGSRVR